MFGDVNGLFATVFQMLQICRQGPLNRGAVGAWGVIHGRAGYGPTSRKPRPINHQLVLGAPNFLGDVSMHLQR